LTKREGEQLVQLLTDHPGPCIAVMDDAYAGMVYEDGLIDRSLFWDLVEQADFDRLVPIRVDGLTKELLFYSGRVGFLTHPFTGQVEEALESKFKCFGRATVGAPPGPPQALANHALGQTSLEQSIEQRKRVLQQRYVTLSEGVAAMKTDRLRPYPFNSGCFVLFDVDRSIPVETLRQRLLEVSTGVIAIPSVNGIRLAYCSMRDEDIPRLLKVLEDTVENF